MNDMKELENWTPESAPRKADLTLFLNRIIQAANDPEVQKDFQAWKEARKNRKKTAFEAYSPPSVPGKRFRQRTGRINNTIARRCSP